MSGSCDRDHEALPHVVVVGPRAQVVVASRARGHEGKIEVPKRGDEVQETHLPEERGVTRKRHALGLATGADWSVHLSKAAAKPLRLSSSRAGQMSA